MPKPKPIPMDEVRAKAHQSAINLWPDEKTRTFTCADCGTKRTIPLEALVSRNLENGHTCLLIQEAHAGNCSNCKRPILELMAFEQRYFLDEHYPKPKAVSRKKARQAEATLDFASAGHVSCYPTAKE